jgi:PAS domain S-box-containing protein
MPTEHQIENISKLLLEYSAGNYSYKGVIGEERNEIDMIISGINMLGEELESSNVSKEYFTSIFNAVSDLIVVISATGESLDANESYKRFFELDDDVTNSIDHLFEYSAVKLKDVKLRLEQSHIPFQFEFRYDKKDKIHYFKTTVSKIVNRFDEFKGFLVNLRDISAERENENEILKAIFTTQQNEQKRVADDLHDSLGQELSVTKLMLSHLKKEVSQEKRALELVETCNEIMEQSIAHLREICFNLMPGILMRGGLILALKDLLKRLENQNDFETILDVDKSFPKLTPDLEIALYRISQEFVNNMIKHSNANQIKIRLQIIDPKNICFELSENGQGFDMKKLEKIGENRGYANLLSKTKAFNGELQYKSKIGSGTSIKINFPI